MKMTSKALLPIGTMVRCRPDMGEQLILWSSHSAEDVDDISAYVDVNEVLVVLNSKTNSRARSKKHVVYSDEWKNGAYLLMSASGAKGWIGEGWVVPV